MFQDLPPVKGAVDPTALPRDDSAAGSEIVRSFVPGLSRAVAAAAVIVSIACTAGYAQLRRPSPAELTPLLETDAVRAGTTARAALVIRLSEGLHTNSNKPRDPLLIPIVLSFQPPAGVSVTEVVYPEPTDLKQEGSAQPLAVFEREFMLGVQMAVAADVPPGELVVPASLRYQACDEKVCYPPVTLPASWTLRVVARNAAVSPVNAAALKTIRFGTGEPPPANASVPAVIAPGESSVASTPFTGTPGRIEDFGVTGTAVGYLGTADFLQFIRNAEAGVKEKGLFEDRGPLAILVLVLLGGLALNLTPCVLPMIPINLAIIGAGAQAGSRARGFLLGATYGAAMALVYGALGLIVILTAGTFGTINASPWFNLGIALLFVVLALAMFDVLVIDFSRFSTRFNVGDGGRGTFLVAFGMGARRGAAGGCLRRAGRDPGDAVLEQPVRLGHGARPGAAVPARRGHGHPLAHCRRRNRGAAPPGRMDGPHQAGLRRGDSRDSRLLRVHGIRNLREPLGRPHPGGVERRRETQRGLVLVAERRARGRETRAEARADRFLGDLVQELPRDGQHHPQGPRRHAGARQLREDQVPG